MCSPSTHDLFFDITYQVAKPLVDSVLLGYSASIIAYGSTASGKTYTILGDTSQPANYGIMPR
jgi:hypothetical protein